jgi:DNA-binding MarR family transcriptional regulator
MAKTSSNNKRNQKYEVILTEEQISFLNAVLSLKETNLTIKKRALILLAIHKDSGKRLTQRQLAESLDVSPSTVLCTIKRFVDRGFDNCMRYQHNSKSTPTRKIQGEQEARLLQLACSQPPNGRSGWSLELLRDKAVELKIIEPLSVETMRSTLKKMNFSLTKTCIGASLQNKMLNL